MKSYYFDFEQIGKLSIEKYLFEGAYPILFTCRSDSDVLYLCVCCGFDEGYQKWLLSEIAPSTIIELLENKITFREAFLKDNKGRYTISRDSNGNKAIEINNPSDWHPEDSFLLPTAGEYMDADDGEFDEEISYYRVMQRDEIADKLQTITISLNPISLSMSAQHVIMYGEFDTICVHAPGYEKGTSFVTYNKTNVQTDVSKLHEILRKAS